MTGRRNHTATLLGDGTVLIIGGSDGPVPRAEIFGPRTGESAVGRGDPPPVGARDCAKAVKLIYDAYELAGRN